MINRGFILKYLILKDFIWLYLLKKIIYLRNNLN